MHEDGFAYVSLHGTLHFDDEPARMTEWSQVEVLSRARDLLAPQHALDRFLSEIIDDEAARKTRKTELSAHGRPFAFGRATRLR